MCVLLLVAMLVLVVVAGWQLHIFTDFPLYLTFYFFCFVCICAVLFAFICLHVLILYVLVWFFPLFASLNLNPNLNLNCKTGAGNAAWTPVENTYNHFLTLDLGGAHMVRKLATMGRMHTDEFVTEYIVQYSDDGEYWRSYVNPTSEPQVY